MAQFERLPSWKWDTDGEVLKGTVMDVRRVEDGFNPGKMVTVIDVDTGNPDVGAKSLWCGNYALRRFAEVEMPQAGDAIVVQRLGKKPFTTKDGEERFMWEFTAECERTGGASDLPLSEPEPEAPVSDDDIPF